MNLFESMKKRLEFRLWAYFRVGWGKYFGFIFAAINTLIVTYFLAIDKMPFLQEIFPTFTHYVVIVILLGVPVLVAVGYIHFKRSQAFKTEADIRIESNPHQRRILLNLELILIVIFRLNNLLLKKINNKKLTEEELEEIIMMQEKIQIYKQHRTISEPILSDIDKINMKKMS